MAKLLAFFLCHRFPAPTKSLHQKNQNYSLCSEQRGGKVKAERSQTAGQDESQPGTCSWAAEGPEGLASPTQGCHAIPKASFQVSLCHLTPQPPSRQVPPRGKPSPANRTMALLRSLQLLTIQNICVYSMTHNGGLFSLERLHHCLSPGAYHVSLYFNFFLIFFFHPKVCMLLFSAPFPCARGNSCFATHGKYCRNISCCSKERIL